jgi:hypothetical protein
MLTADYFNRIGVDHLPGRLGIVITYAGPSEVRSELPKGLRVSPRLS